ncbi:ExbD/TolR family protein [Puia dinghuensis]|uniref:Biopolymer transporter ExbD n=1 Tax=Puia dinghuensis TaxID=1792502 RepID=A0A8J2UI29_9BACT|nr:biopolymer transporter ExbD [Puia dinghuensis]GGB18917.1 biopolymer transporter ExbD [Puia dinghuensis]
MGRAKIPRKSTNIDMTAMCDVAFLLLSFFILATKFKPAEALTVVTPSSVSSKVAPDKNVIMVTIDHDGKVYFSVSDANATEKKEILEAIATSKNITLTDAEKKNFYANPSSYIGVPFTGLKHYLDLGPDQLKNLALPGIPAQDSTNNELTDWVRAAVTVSAGGGFNGGHMNILVKGDDAAKYPAFQGAIIAFKKNDQLKFQLVTSPVAPPPGSELDKLQQKTGNKSSEQ